MPHIRPFRPGDEAAVADICLKTADAGADATGVFDDDAIWAEIFVLPYVHRHPDLAFVVEADDGRVVGYIVCAPDTNAFEDWFHDEWWPERGARWPRARHRADASGRHADLRVLASRAAPSRTATSTPRTCTSTCCPKCRARAGGGA